MSVTGKKAEAFAAKLLRDRGYEILARNWKSRFAEIDLIACKDQTLHFIEVKYRKSSQHGAAREYLTPKKLRQVRFAAKLWLQKNDWEGPTQVDGVAITGSLNESNTEVYQNI